MAINTRSKIAVFVVDGNYSALRELGFPLPALAAMQGAGVQLGHACWDVKQSNSGISLSFFWPQSLRQSQLSSAQITKPKKRRRRKSKVIMISQRIPIMSVVKIVTNGNLRPRLFHLEHLSRSQGVE